MAESLGNRSGAKTIKWLAAITSAAILLLGLSVSANASTTLNPDTGMGFVGKGDIQTPWGWNDTQLQQNFALYDDKGTLTTADDVRALNIKLKTHFDAVTTVCEATYDLEVTENNKGVKTTTTDTFTKTKSASKTSNIFSYLALDGRTNNSKVTGINLKGLDKPTSDLPEQGEACDVPSAPATDMYGEPVVGTYTSVTIDGEPTTSLLANYTTTGKEIIGYTTVKGKKTAIRSDPGIKLDEITLWKDGVSTTP